MSLLKFRNSLIKAAVLFAVMVPCALYAGTVALVSVQNLSQDPEYDYLAAFSEGVILFDLSSVDEITLVERNRLSKIISEQSLQLSGLTGAGQEKKSIEVGKLLAADYLITVDYTIVNDEVAFTLRLADTTTGAVRVFSSRGSTENEIHRLSESLVKSLTGKKRSFINESEKRSLITLRDMVPGSISLYCNLVHAEILLDDRFAGYTTGNLYDPLSLSDLDPGTYTMTIRLSRDFGVVKLPEFTFSDWQEKVTVKPGRSTTLRSVIHHFNDIIYKEMRLIDKDYDLTDRKPVVNETESVSFTDRQGKTVSMKVSVKGERKEGRGATVKCGFTYNGKAYSYSLSKDGNSAKQDIGKVRLELKLETGRTDRDRVSVEITRTDIRQGMHREE